MVTSKQVIREELVRDVGMLACSDAGDRHWHGRKKVGRRKSTEKGALGKKSIT